MRQVAASLGFQFVSRTNDTETVVVHGREETYQVLGVHAFDATRKRMSMVVRAPDGQAMLLIKGADNVMLERVSREQSVDVLNSHLTDFSKLGLRTLVLGRRLLTPMEADAWHTAYKVLIVHACELSVSLSGPASSGLSVWSVDHDHGWLHFVCRLMPVCCSEL